MTTSESPSSPHSQSLHQRKNSNALENSPEKENQSPQLKRPLPVPKEVQPVPASSFYGTSSKQSKAQPLTAGSSHTVYAESLTPPPPYHAKETSPFRQPELVAEEPIPPLIPTENAGGSSDNWSMDNNEWGNVTATPWDSVYAHGGWNSTPSQSVDIDGRDAEEELNWADKEVRERCKRPGPGVLPPLLTQLLHNPDHTLYSVTAHVPDVSATASRSSTRSTSSSVTSSPNACRACSSSISRRSTARDPTSTRVLLQRAQWLGPFALAVVFSASTHRAVVHANVYERAVDARTLMTPYKRSDWEQDVRQKQRRRKMTIHMDDEGREIPPPSMASAETEQRAEEEADMLDLYLCCQCSTYCLVSDVIPGVIPVRYLEEFNKDKLENPPPGKTGDLSLITGWETVITILSNKLWKNETRVLPVARPKFRSKIGWNLAVRRIFEALDFKIDMVNSSASKPEESLCSPPIELSTPEGRRSRAKMLRAWVEINAWLTLYEKSRPRDDASFVPSPLSANVESATEAIQTALGAHINQSMARLGVITNVLQPRTTHVRVSRAMPLRPSQHISSLHALLQDRGHNERSRRLSPRPAGDAHCGEERSRHRFTTEDLEQAISLLGFGKDNILSVELDEDVDDQFIIDAWKNAQKRAWRAFRALGPESIRRLKSFIHSRVQLRRVAAICRVHGRDDGGAASWICEHAHLCFLLREVCGHLERAKLEPKLDHKRQLLAYGRDSALEKRLRLSFASQYVRKLASSHASHGFSTCAH
ncbi:hypothetical protein NM688_g1094 [Phlebia brevispora]|uniref:Uncharacterized protein n=1 Tax=Phlebia brevispora TaxID=194682 RepID=A0ACC1TCQ6_9APHY|nr:hypothetical protein NM688_g1094 [Phlebia brevispora]